MGQKRGHVERSLFQVQDDENRSTQSRNVMGNESGQRKGTAETPRGSTAVGVSSVSQQNPEVEDSQLFEVKLVLFSFSSSSNVINWRSEQQLQRRSDYASSFAHEGWNPEHYLYGSS